MHYQKKCRGTASVALRVRREPLAKKRRDQCGGTYIECIAALQPQINVSDWKHVFLQPRPFLSLGLMVGSHLDKAGGHRGLPLRHSR